mgnify:CR=1 FL=1
MPQRSNTYSPSKKLRILLISYSITARDFGSSGKDQTYPEGNLEIKRAMMVGCALLHPAAMIRKSVLTDNNIRYEAAYTPAEDYMLWVRLLGVTMFHNLKDPLIQYRNSVSNTSHQRVEQMKDADLRIKSIAQTLYPTFYIKNSSKKWITICGILPLLKIKYNGQSLNVKLFGIIPVISINFFKNYYMRPRHFLPKHGYTRSLIISLIILLKYDSILFI